MKSNLILMIQPRPAQFSERDNSYQVAKNGYISFDFSPVEEDGKTVKVHEKKTFILTMKNVGDILDLNTKDPFNEAVDSEGTFVQYSPKEDEPIRVLRMNKQPKRNFQFSYCEIKNENVESALTVELTAGEVRNVQTLIEYSIPLLLGWHCIYNPSVVKQ